ncbi:conserved hypothetical protein [Burkholderia sp. 8Y]|uniref:hypothetical protein n=1 Tax=Burkholderia sp. 8Y TaxID=2653133 RepID=UPI0012F25F9B|nr:hypothetical protein [Burkholderia sp. 8Y]VXB87315.1 conserved hypothetical protein [Burkholderia sp. 8Y]
MPLSACTPVHARRARPGYTPSSLRTEIARRFDARSAARVTRFGRIYFGGSRYVCVSAPDIERGGFYALYFFHHGANDWRIYPPPGIGPSIVYSSVAASSKSVEAAPG